MRLPPRSSLAFWGFLLALVAVTFVRIDLRDRPGVVAAVDAAPARAEAVDDAVIVPVPPAPVATQAAPEPVSETDTVAHRIFADTLGRDGSIYLSLKAHDVPELEIARVGQALDGVFDAARETRAGDVVRLELDGGHRVLRFEYVPRRAPERPVVIERRGDVLTGRRESLELDTRTAAIEVAIEDNLFNAIAGTGESDALTDLLVDRVFGSVIDFHKDPRRGDRLSVLFTRKYLGDRFIRYGDVLLARYEGQVVTQEAVHFEDPTGVADFYDEGGTSLERMFLLKPMEFRRISSRFSRQRFHPILKRNIPHLGTDYAASTGTPVWSTARGRVTHAGWNGGYGKMVEVEHPNGYKTRYAHLSRIRVRVGARVDKFDIVGNVGMTGRATGPHLHYELLHNGKQINPSLVNRGDKARVLDAAYIDAFRALRHRRDDRLRELLRATAPVIADAGTGPLDRSTGAR